jgi:hypothetical protein
VDFRVEKTRGHAIFQSSGKKNHEKCHPCYLIIMLFAYNQRRRGEGGRKKSKRKKHPESEIGFCPRKCVEEAGAVGGGRGAEGN